MVYMPLDVTVAGFEGAFLVLFVRLVEAALVWINMGISNIERRFHDNLIPLRISCLVFG